MYSLDEIDRMEREYREGHPSLGRALQMLEARWSYGVREDETAIRLLFLLWYNVVEPITLTGLPADTAEGRFSCVFEEAGGEASASPFVLYAVGMMAQMFPWAIGDEAEWSEKAERLLEKASRESPGITAEAFRGFGAAGDYFQHILSAGNGAYNNSLKPTRNQDAL